MSTKTQKKGAVTPQETVTNFPVSVQESPAEVWFGGGLVVSLLVTLSAAVQAWDLLKESNIIFITSTIVCHQVKQQRGNRIPAINRKLD